MEKRGCYPWAACLDTHVVCWRWVCGQQHTDHVDCDVFPVRFLVVALRDIADIGPTVLQFCILDDEDGADLVGGSGQEVGHRLHRLPCLHNRDRRYSLRSEEHVLALELQSRAHREGGGEGRGPQSGCNRNREHAPIRGQ